MNLSRSELALTANALASDISRTKRRLKDAEENVNIPLVLSCEERLEILKSVRGKVTRELIR